MKKWSILTALVLVLALPIAAHPADGSGPAATVAVVEEGGGERARWDRAFEGLGGQAAAKADDPQTRDPVERTFEEFEMTIQKMNEENGPALGFIAAALVTIAIAAAIAAMD